MQKMLQLAVGLHALGGARVHVALAAYVLCQGESLVVTISVINHLLSGACEVRALGATLSLAFREVDLYEMCGHFGLAVCVQGTEGALHPTFEVSVECKGWFGVH